MPVFEALYTTRKHMTINDFNQRLINTGATAGIALFAFIVINIFWGPFREAENIIYSPLGTICASAFFWVISPLVASALKSTPKINMLWVLGGAIVIVPITLLTVSIMQ